MIYELKGEIPMAGVARIEEVLAELEEQSLMVLEDKPAGRAWVVGYVGSTEDGLARWRNLRGSIGAAFLNEEPTIRELPDVDWKESYKAHFSASKFGRLHWVPVWEKEKFVLPKGEEVLWLDPGMAFGTGKHETTRLCCERLSEHAATNGNRGRVIDAGCGSGILALSSVKLGFTEVFGFDNDPEAIRVSHENAALNGLERAATFQVDDLLSGFAGRKAELVMVNIQADILIRFARVISDGLAPGGELVLSGVLAHELNEVRTAFAPFMMGKAFRSRQLGEWVDLDFWS